MVRSRWIVGADGAHSRAPVDLDEHVNYQRRFAFRVTTALPPDQLYGASLGANCQLYVTQLRPMKSVVAAISGILASPRCAIAEFPSIADRLEGLERTTD